MIQIHLALQEYMRSAKKYVPTAKIQANRNEVLEVVANYHRISTDELMTRSRQRKIVLPRQQAAYIMRVNGHTLQSIAEYLLQDHTTILHTIKVVKDTMHTDPDYRTQIDNLLYNVSKLTHATTQTAS